MSADTIAGPRVREADLLRFVEQALVAVGVGEDAARIVAEVLVAADRRGIESHGVARLRWFYVDRIRNGRIAAHPRYEIVRERDGTFLMDAGNGLGHPASHYAMTRTIAKAKDVGIAFSAVRNSNHYGIAGYYAMMALEHDMIGICTTDSAHFAVPTFGRTKMQGTNPFAFAVPADEEPPFVLDFATTTVTYGKLEVYERKALTLKPGWAVDGDGNPTTDPAARHWGSLLPLGGFGTETGGHKGYGLGVLSELLTGVLAAGWFGAALTLDEKPDAPSGITSHFFGAIRIDALRDVDEFKRHMDRELRTFKTSAPAPGHDRVYVAGEIEHENEIAFRRDGIPLIAPVLADLDALAAELGIEPPLRR
ncbi:MAG TPA: Ldh family oxidoreductase [Candidatus Elarobacter sp.]|jgi:LDH2 family malate/lactate/ureidoglycolate dehydrogenase|nr:Ldh family oxidoreductase [Candidatus Elarobacter sp.]